MPLWPIKTKLQNDMLKPIMCCGLVVFLLVVICHVVNGRSFRVAVVLATDLGRI